MREVAVSHGTHAGTDVRRLETLEFKESGIVLLFGAEMVVRFAAF